MEEEGGVEAAAARNVAAASSSATGLITLNPSRVEFRDVRVGEEQTVDVFVTSNLASDIDMTIRAGNSDRYTVTPDKLTLRNGETATVSIKLKLMRQPPQQKRRMARGASDDEGFRDHFYIKSIYFDQRFASIFYLAPKHETSKKPTPASHQMTSTGVASDQQRKTQSEGQAGGPRARQRSVTFDLPEERGPLMPAGGANQRRSRITDKPVANRGHRIGEDVEASSVPEHDDEDYTRLAASAQQNEDVIRDKNSIIQALQRRLAQTEAMLHETSHSGRGETAVASTPGTRGVAVLSRAMQVSASDMRQVQEANESLRQQLNVAHAELSAMREFVASFEASVPDGPELVRAAVLRERAIAEERHNNSLALLSSKDMALRESESRLDDLSVSNTRMRDALDETQSSLRQSEARCAEAIESRASLRNELHRKDDEILKLKQALHNENNKRAAHETTSEVARLFEEETLKWRATAAEKDSEIDVLRKEIEFFQSSLEQARSELSVKRIEENERAREHEDAIAALSRENEKRVSDLRMEIAEHRARAERQAHTQSLECPASVAVDTSVYERTGGLARDIQNAKDEIKTMIDDASVAGRSGATGGLKDFVQVQMRQIGDLQMQLAQKNAELAMAGNCESGASRDACDEADGAITPATAARMRQKIAKLAASEEGLRAALEQAEAKALTAENGVDEAQQKISCMREELHETRLQLQALQQRQSNGDDGFARPSTGGEAMEKISKDILREIADDAESEISELRSELQSEREDHMYTKITAEADISRLTLEIEDLQHKLRHHANDGAIHKQRLLQTIRTLSSRSDLHREVAKSSTEISRLTRSEAKLQSDIEHNEKRIAKLTNELQETRSGVLKSLHRPDARRLAEAETDTSDLADSVVSVEQGKVEVPAQTTDRLEAIQRALLKRENQLAQARADIEIIRLDGDRLRAKLAEASKEVVDGREMVAERDRQLYDCREKLRQQANDLASRYRSEITNLSTRVAVAERREQEACVTREEAERRVRNAKDEIEKLRSTFASSRALHEKEVGRSRSSLRAAEEESARSMREIEQLSSLVEEKTLQIQVLTDTLEALQTSSTTEIEQGIVTISAQLAAMKAQEQTMERRALDAMGKVESMRRALELSQSDLNESRELVISRDAQIAELREAHAIAGKEAQSMRTELRSHEEKISMGARALDDAEDKLRKKETEIEDMRKALAYQRQKHFDQLTAERSAIRAECHERETGLSVSACAPGSGKKLELLVVGLIDTLSKQREDVLWDSTDKEASFTVIKHLCTELSDVEQRLNAMVSSERVATNRRLAADARSRQLEMELDEELTTSFHLRSRLEASESLSERKHKVAFEHMSAYLIHQGRRIGVLSNALEKSNAALLSIESKCASNERQHAVTLNSLENSNHALKLAQAEVDELTLEVSALREELEGCRGDTLEMRLNAFYQNYIEGTINEDASASGKFAVLTKQVLALKYNEQSIQSNLAATKMRLHGSRQKCIRVTEELQGLQRRNELLSVGKDLRSFSPSEPEGDLSNAKAEVAKELSTFRKDNEALNQSCAALRQRVAELELELDSLVIHARRSEETERVLRAEHQGALQRLREQLIDEHATRLNAMQEGAAAEKRAMEEQIASLKLEHESSLESKRAEYHEKVTRLEEQHDDHVSKLKRAHSEAFEERERTSVPCEQMKKTEEECSELRSQLESYTAENMALAEELRKVGMASKSLQEDVERKDIAIGELEQGLRRLTSDVHKGGGDVTAASIVKQHLVGKLHEAELLRRIRVSARTELELRELLRRREARIDELKVQVKGATADSGSVHTSADTTGGSSSIHESGSLTKLIAAEVEVEFMKTRLAEYVANDAGAVDSSKEDYKLLYQQFENLSSRADLVSAQLKELQAESSFSVGLMMGAVAKSHRSSHVQGQGQDSVSLKGAVQLVLHRLSEYESKMKAMKSEIVQRDNKVPMPKPEPRDGNEALTASRSHSEQDAQRDMIAGLQKQVAQLGRERINLLQEKDRLAERLRSLRHAVSSGKHQRRATAPLRDRDAEAVAARETCSAWSQTDCSLGMSTSEEYAEAWKARCHALEEEVASQREFAELRERAIQQHVNDASRAYLNELQSEDVFANALGVAREQAVRDASGSSHISSSSLADTRRRELDFMAKEKELQHIRARRGSESELERLRGDVVQLRAAVKFERSGRERTREELDSVMARLERCDDEVKSLRRRLKEATSEASCLRDHNRELQQEATRAVGGLKSSGTGHQLAFGSTFARSAVELLEKKLCVMEKSLSLFQRSSTIAIDNLSKRADGVERLASSGSVRSVDAVAEIENAVRDSDDMLEWMSRAMREANEARATYGAEEDKFIKRTAEAAKIVEEERNARDASDRRSAELERKVQSLEADSNRPRVSKATLLRLRNQVADLESKLSKSSEDVSTMEAERSVLQSRLMSVEKSNVALESTLKDAKSELSRIINNSGRPVEKAQRAAARSAARNTSRTTIVQLAPTKKKKISGTARTELMSLRDEIRDIESIIMSERENAQDIGRELDSARSESVTLRERNKTLASQTKMVRERNTHLQAQMKKMESAGSIVDENAAIANITNASNELQQHKSAMASLRRQLLCAQSDVSQKERQMKVSMEEKEDLMSQVKDLQRRLRHALTAAVKRDEVHAEPAREKSEKDAKLIDASGALDGKLSALQSRIRDLSANLKRKDHQNGELRNQARRLSSELEALKVSMEVEASKTSSTTRRLRSDIAKKDEMIKAFEKKMTEISASTAMATSEAAAASRREVQAWRVAGAESAVMRHCAAIMLSSLQEAALLCIRVTGGMRRLAYVCCIISLRANERASPSQPVPRQGSSASGDASSVLQLPSDAESISSIAKMVGLQEGEVSDLLHIGHSRTERARKAIEYDMGTKQEEEQAIRKLCGEIEAGLGRASVSDAAVADPSATSATPASVISAKGALFFDEEPLHSLLELLESAVMKAETSAAEARGAVKSSVSA